MKKHLCSKVILFLAVFSLLLFKSSPILLASTLNDTLNLNPAEAAPSPGEIVLTKSAKPIGTNAENREFQIELTMKGTPLESAVSADIVLVIDLSQSMASPIEGGAGSRLKSIKDAASSFIMNALPDTTANRLALVTYSGSPQDGPDNDAWINYSFDSWNGRSTSLNRMYLLSSVATLATDDGTNMEAGFAKTDSVLNQSTSKNKIVIFMTDGEPTFYYDENGETTGNGTSFESTAADQAISAAMTLRQNHNATIYTVGLVADDALAGNMASVLSPDDSSYNAAYYQASDNQGISSIYTHLANSIDLIARDVKLVDQIQSGFSYVSGSLQTKGLPDNASTDATISLTPVSEDSYLSVDTYPGEVRWHPDVLSDEIITVSYRVIADDRIYGALPTNRKAWLEFLPAAGNLFYNDSGFDSSVSDGSRLIEFEHPIVIADPIACDDDFYRVEAGKALQVGGNFKLPCLLANDPAMYYLSSTHGWQTTAVCIEPVDIDRTNLGTITGFKNDGSFTYISKADVTGTDSFTYDLKTTVSNNSGYSEVLFSRATVTISVIPAAINSAAPVQTEIILDESQTGRTGEQAPSGIGISAAAIMLLILTGVLLLIRKALLRNATM